MGRSSNSTLVILAFFSIYVIWGSTYLLNKIAVLELPPFMLASFRFTTAGVLIFVMAKLMGIPISITKKQLLNTIIAGFLFLSFGNGVVVWALKYVDTGFCCFGDIRSTADYSFVDANTSGKENPAHVGYWCNIGNCGHLSFGESKTDQYQRGIYYGNDYDLCLYAQLGLRKSFCWQGRPSHQLFCKYRVPNVHRRYYFGFDELVLWRKLDFSLGLDQQGTACYGAIGHFWQYLGVYILQLSFKIGFPRKKWQPLPM